MSEPKGKIITIRVPDELRKRANKKAVDLETSLQAILAEALRQWVEKADSSPPPRPSLTASRYQKENIPWHEKLEVVLEDGETRGGIEQNLDWAEAATLRLSKDKTDVIKIPVSAVTEISYGQDVHRRVGAAIGLALISFGIGALMALAKSKKHFVGLTWVDGDQKGGFAMQCGKGDYRGMIAGLEGVTGKKAVDSDALNVKN